MTTTPPGQGNANPNQTAQQRQNAFGSRPASPFAQNTTTRAAATPAPAAQPAANNNAGGGSLLRRPFNNQQQETLQWTVMPLGKSGVRFQLGGLGDPFHRLMGTPLNTEYGNPAKVIQALQEDASLREKLEALLDEAWESYGFRGAAMLFPWEAEVRRAFTSMPLPDTPPPAVNPGTKEEAEEENWLDSLAAAPGSKVCDCVRAIDLLFVLNVLARARAQILVEATPLALEPGFLDQVYVTDDPRLVALAQATGCIEEVW